MIVLYSLEGLARFQSVWRNISISMIYCKNQSSVKKLKVERKVDDALNEIRHYANLSGKASTIAEGVKSILDKGLEFVVHHFTHLSQHDLLNSIMIEQ